MPYSFKDHTILWKQSSANNFSAQPAYGIGLSGTKHYIINVATDVEPTGLSSESGFVNLYELNTWYRLIARKQDSIIYLTTNDIDEKSFIYVQRTIEGNIPYDSSPLLIGSRTRQQSNTFEGKIDDIKIYNRFMTLEGVTGISFDDEEEENSEEEMEDDPELEDDTSEIDFNVDLKIIIDPWKFLLMKSQDRIIENVKFFKGSDLIIEKEFDSNIASLNIQTIPSGAYRLEVLTDEGVMEQELIID